jgi:hypothetical protein
MSQGSGDNTGSVWYDTKWAVLREFFSEEVEWVLRDALVEGGERDSSVIHLFTYYLLKHIVCQKLKRRN